MGGTSGGASCSCLCKDALTLGIDSPSHLSARARRSGRARLGRRAGPLHQPYVPAAVDFSQPVPDSVQLREPSARAAAAADDRAGYGLDGPVLYRSRPAEAPHRFDLVGIAGQMHAFEFRVRDDGGEWTGGSRPTTATPSTPAAATRSRSAAATRRSPASSTTSTSRATPPSPAACSTACGRTVNSAVVTLAGVPAASAIRPGAELHHPPRVGREAEARRMRAPRAAADGPDQGGRHSPHRQHERLLRGGGARDRARHLPLPPQRQRLERHRLQRPRRSLRQRLPGPCRRDVAAGDRRSRRGRERPDDRRRRDRQLHARRSPRGPSATG